MTVTQDMRLVVDVQDAGLEARSGALIKSAFWKKIEAHPHRADLFSVLRWIDCRDGSNPPLGRAARPHFEAIRLGQEPSMAFAASEVAEVNPDNGNKPPRLTIYSFGLFGPNGPLPLHLTEYARDRLRRFGDPTMVRFADIFHHRLILLFYRAWADAQPTSSLDRAEADRFTNYVASLIGYGQPSLRSRDAVQDHAKLLHAQHFARQTRNPEGLAKILASYFQVPVKIAEYVPHWIALDAAEQTRLSRQRGNNGLGVDAVLGSQVLDAQHKIRVQVGPLTFEQYRNFLPGAVAASKMVAWIKNYVGLEFLVDVQLVLARREVKPTSLGNMTQLGWASWLGNVQQENDPDDFVFECCS